MATWRIVLLGKTGDGKSSSGNLIVGEEVFPTRCSPNSQTHKCKVETKSIHEKEISVVDPPGFFDTALSSEEINSEIVRCITECAPGPHAFLITLKVGRYTEHENEIVKKITSSFGEEALKYAVVLFTFGDQLSEDQTIEDFVKESKELQDLVNKCGGRVHVIDNKYWNEQQDGYRSNSVQVQKLLNTIEEMVNDNGGKCFTNEMLQAVDKAIDTEFKALCETSKEIPDKNMMRDQAKQRVHTKLSVRLMGVATGALLGALLGIVGSGIIVISALKGVGVASAVGAGCAAGPWITTGSAIVLGTGSAAGAVAGGITGYHAVEGLDNVCDAMKNVYKKTMESAQNVRENIEQLVNPTDYHKLKQN